MIDISSKPLAIAAALTAALGWAGNEIYTGIKDSIIEANNKSKIAIEKAESNHDAYANLATVQAITDNRVATQGEDIKFIKEILIKWDKQAYGGRNTR